MNDYKIDPRVTPTGDGDYLIDIESSSRPWRVFHEGSRWFSECPDGIPGREGPLVFEHPSEGEALAALLDPSGGKVIVPERCGP